MKRTITIVVIAIFLAGTAVYSAHRKGTDKPTLDQSPVPKTITKKKPVEKKSAPPPKVDIVIALDTSGSMSGLINAARQKLWEIVNEVAKAKPAPRLRVGLATFGSIGSEADGYVVIQSDLTTDLDAIYSKLFELRTMGGTEYVGRVVYRSIKEMSWNRDQNTLRQIYVAGNESADQDRRVTAASAMELARKRNIFVNAIYCGNRSDHDAKSWHRVAQRGLGMYASIDHNHGTVAIASPFDAELNALSARLNRTYVAYGRLGIAASANQVAQDKNALRAHASTAASRALAKASGVYRNEKWDLVDARKAGKLKKVKSVDLPPALRGKSKTEVNAYLNAKEQERKQIKQKIRDLSKKRQAYVQIEMKKRGKTGNSSFSMAVKKALHRQAAQKKINLR